METGNKIRRKAVSLLRKNKDLEWIAEHLDIDKNQVRAYKAHLTMGTYSRLSEKKESKKRYIGKETLIELLRFGIPDELLLAKYRGLKQSALHVYKAHITQGHYD